MANANANANAFALGHISGRFTRPVLSLAAHQGLFWCWSVGAQRRCQVILPVLLSVTRYGSLKW